MIEIYLKILKKMLLKLSKTLKNITPPKHSTI